MMMHTTASTTTAGRSNEHALVTLLAARLTACENDASAWQRDYNNEKDRIAKYTSEKQHLNAAWRKAIHENETERRRIWDEINKLGANQDLTVEGGGVAKKGQTDEEEEKAYKAFINSCSPATKTQVPPHQAENYLGAVFTDLEQRHPRPGLRAFVERYKQRKNAPPCSQDEVAGFRVEGRGKFCTSCHVNFEPGTEAWRGFVEGGVRCENHLWCLECAPYVASRCEFDCPFRFGAGDFTTGDFTNTIRIKECVRRRE